MDQVDLLVEILLDKNASVAERDDAAMYLGEYDDDRALAALIKICVDKSEDEFIFANCGQSVASIWVKRNKFNKKIYDEMVPESQWEVYYYINGNKPEWIKEYELQRP